MTSARPRLGVSSCLLGNRVRYDGRHKRNDTVANTLGTLFDWIPICPEVEAGMSTPRPPLHLVQGNGRIQLLEIESRRDRSTSIDDFSRMRIKELDRIEISGCVLKQNSPSCGPSGVPIHNASGTQVGRGRGIFAAELLRVFPELPIADENELSNPEQRKHFIERALAYRR